MKQVFCVMRMGECYEGCEEFVIAFTTKDLARQYINKQHDPSIYRISTRKVFDKMI